MKSPRSTGSFNEMRSISNDGSSSDCAPFAFPLRGVATVEGCGAELVGGIKASDTEDARPEDLIDRTSDNKRVERGGGGNGKTLSSNGRRVVMMTGFWKWEKRK